MGLTDDAATARQQTGPQARRDEGPPDEEEVKRARATNRFDIRRIVGGLFILYGGILTVMGIAGSYALRHKAAGINVDLWTGLGMLLFGILMLWWALARPTIPNPEAVRGEEREQLRETPAA